MEAAAAAAGIADATGGTGKNQRPHTENRSSKPMIPELGHFALILALSIALAQGMFPLLGVARGNLVWMRMGRTAAPGQFLFIAIALGVLTYAFIVKDFSVRYVA